MEDPAFELAVPQAPATVVDAVVVGAGFGGIYALKRLRDLGLNVVAIEAGEDVGGTWFWNTYPGARCDIESVEYCYSFDEELQGDWRWSERFAAQPEILDYARHVVDRFELRPSIRFDTRVTAATWDEEHGRWQVRTDGPEHYEATFFIAATGALSRPALPDYPGWDQYQGAVLHTGAWPKEGFDFAGKRVAVIGTGSSGIQSIPPIAEMADHLTVFQRTAAFAIPARNHAMSEAEQVRRTAAEYEIFRTRAQRYPMGLDLDLQQQSALELSDDERLERYETRWADGGFGILGSFNDLVVDPKSNDTLAEFIREKIREVITDPATADKLTPRGYYVATKRICLHTQYFETFNRPDVELVDIRASPIQEITQTGIRTTEGEHALDAIVLATGYDAITGALLAIDIRGTDGIALADKWREGPATSFGVMTSGFPNLLFVSGPGSPSILTNVLAAIEQSVDWIADCLQYLRDHEITRIEADGEAEQAWFQHVTDRADATLLPTAESWYKGANIPGKPRMFVPYCGGLPDYGEHIAASAANGYAGFQLGEPAAATTRA